VNLAASYDIDDHVEVFGRIENLAEEDYYEVFGFPAQPRTATVGARVKF
jgi:vitamin B12 transporter